MQTYCLPHTAYVWVGMLASFLHLIGILLCFQCSNICTNYYTRIGHTEISRIILNTRSFSFHAHYACMHRISRCRYLHHGIAYDSLFGRAERLLITFRCLRFLVERRY